MKRLESAGEVVLLDNPDERNLIAVVGEADGLVVRTYSEVTSRVIAAAAKTGRLKVIGRAGIGVDNIDVRASVDAGIPVVHTPAASTNAVADFTVGLIIGLQRRIVAFDAAVRQGRFTDLRSDTPPVVELRHQTLGVIGMGKIGSAVGKRLSLGFDMRVIYYDIRDIDGLSFPAEAKASAADVYGEADVVTIHVPLTGQTRGMVDAGALSQFKKGSCLINTSRGPVVDGVALSAALQNGQLAGAALDVFDPEPPPPDHPLRSAPNCVMTPHVASRTQEGVKAMNDVVDDVIGVLQGNPPRYPADPNLS